MITKKGHESIRKKNEESFLLVANKVDAPLMLSPPSPFYPCLCHYGVISHSTNVHFSISLIEYKDG